MRDPYTVLGVDKTAGQDEIKSAFRRLVKELHPDLNPGDKIVEQKFKEVSAAYEILSDPDKRGKFDRGEIGRDGQPRTAHTAAGAGGPGFSAADFDWAKARRATERERQRRGKGGPGGTGGGFNASDIFDDLFGRGGVRGRGGDVAYSITIDFLEATRGAKRRIQLSDGSEIDVTIPPGTENQAQLRLRGKGQPGMGGGEPGDALVEVMVVDHPHFQRRDEDIHLDLPITLKEAVLGARIEVPTVHGPVVVKVPRGANTGTSLRLKGKGVPNRDGSPGGDQYVKLKVMLPEAPDGALTEFVSKWDEPVTYNPRRRAGLE